MTASASSRRPPVGRPTAVVGSRRTCRWTSPSRRPRTPRSRPGRSRAIPGPVRPAIDGAGRPMPGAASARTTRRRSARGAAATRSDGAPVRAGPDRRPRPGRARAARGSGPPPQAADRRGGRRAARRGGRLGGGRDAGCLDRSPRRRVVAGLDRVRARSATARASAADAPATSPSPHAHRPTPADADAQRDPTHRPRAPRPPWSRPG